MVIVPKFKCRASPIAEPRLFFPIELIIGERTLPLKGFTMHKFCEETLPLTGPGQDHGENLQGLSYSNLFLTVPTVLSNPDDYAKVHLK